jgi:hypothetical protein
VAGIDVQISPVRAQGLDAYFQAAGRVRLCRRDGHSADQRSGTSHHRQAEHEAYTPTGEQARGIREHLAHLPFFEVTVTPKYRVQTA